MAGSSPIKVEDGRPAMTNQRPNFGFPRLVCPFILA
jgi:hypothetical protein